MRPRRAWRCQSSMAGGIREDLVKLRIEFDEWFNEKTLFVNGQFESSMSLLRDRGYVTEHDDAVWFASTLLGDDKDKVLVRGNGIPTYFASDVAYHYNKLYEREFDRVINIWGAATKGTRSSEGSGRGTGNARRTG